MSFRSFAVSVLAAAPALAQGPGPAVRALVPSGVTSSITFSQVQHLRALSDGRVLVNDPGKRQVILLDAALSNPKIVVDSGGGESMYGMNAGALIPFASDSTLFVDRNASAFLVIDPKGEVTRVMSMPPGNPATYLTSPTSYGFPAYSAGLGLVYRIPMPRPQIQRPREGEPAINRTYDDSALVMTMNVKRRSVDTLARVATGSIVAMQLSFNNTNTSTRTPIFPVFDDWTVMSDGAVAIMRGREYRVDFYSADGTKTPGPRLPYPWKQLDDVEKTRIVDSINTQRRKQFDDMIEDLRKRALDTTQRVGAGGEKIILVDNMPIRTYNGERMPPPTPPQPVLTAELPDYLPAVERNVASFRADADNRLWCRPKPATGTPRGGGAVYDLLDRTGALTARVQLPPGKNIVGFAPGGVVFVTSRDAGATRLEKLLFK